MQDSMFCRVLRESSIKNQLNEVLLGPSTANFQRTKGTGVKILFDSDEDTAVLKHLSV